jgi:hypothetical protein
VRDLHNSLERQRRVDLKNAFDTLKVCVPEIAASDKASKLLILTKARDFCLSLGTREGQLRRETERLRMRQQLLSNRHRPNITIPISKVIWRQVFIYLRPPPLP